MMPPVSVTEVAVSVTVPPAHVVVGVTARSTLRPAGKLSVTLVTVTVVVGSLLSSVMVSVESVPKLTFGGVNALLMPTVSAHRASDAQTRTENKIRMRPKSARADRGTPRAPRIHDGPKPPIPP